MVQVEGEKVHLICKTILVKSNTKSSIDCSLAWNTTYGVQVNIRKYMENGNNNHRIADRIQANMSLLLLLI